MNKYKVITFDGFQYRFEDSKSLVKLVDHIRTCPNQSFLTINSKHSVRIDDIRRIEKED